MADDRIRQERDDGHFGLIAFKIAQLVWQNGTGKNRQPEIGHYIPHLAKSPEDSIRQMANMARLFHEAMSEPEVETASTPEEQKKLEEKRQAKLKRRAEAAASLASSQQAG